MEERVTQLDEGLKVALPPFQDLLSLRIDDENFVIGKEYLSSGEINLRAGKKRHMRIQIVTRSL